MQAKTLLITDLQNRVAEWAKEQPAVISVETLGSIGRTAEPEDVDLMVVYDTRQVNGLQAMQTLRPGLHETVRTATGLKADITLLSPGERDEPGFPLDVGSVSVLYTRP